eukprot:3933061-Rhodomonas_salina.2
MCLRIAGTNAWVLAGYLQPSTGSGPAGPFGGFRRLSEGAVSGGGDDCQLTDGHGDDRAQVEIR